MKKFLLLLMVAALSFSLISCEKEVKESVTPPESEVEAEIPEEAVPEENEDVAEAPEEKVEEKKAQPVVAPKKEEAKPEEPEQEKEVRTMWHQLPKDSPIADKAEFDNLAAKYPAYAEVLKRYKSAMVAGASEWEEKYSSGEINLNTLILGNFHVYGEPNSISYALYDVDKNGVSEFFVIDSTGGNKAVIDAYMMSGNKAARVFPDIEFGERILLHVLTDGRLVVDGSNSAFSSSAAVYKLEGSLKKESEFWYSAESGDSYPGEKITLEEWATRFEEFDFTSAIYEMKIIPYI